MKKISVLLIILLCLNCLCSCDPNHIRAYNNSEDNKSITESIELIYYENDSSKEIFLSLYNFKFNLKNYKSFDFTKMRVIDTLPSDKQNDFLDDLYNIWLLDYTPYDSPAKECVKINYKDGSFDIICFNWSYSATFDSNGNLVKTIGTGAGTALKELVNDYFEMVLE